MKNNNNCQRVNMDDDLLVNTRKKRANAGSRLKQLLSAEGVPEEDVDLLFVEDEDDKEYESGSEDSEEQEDQEEEEEQEEQQSTLVESETVEQQNDTESGDEEEPPNDEMFSDSSDESSSQESDQGEKDLQKQERAKKQKKKFIVPKIKQPAVSKPKVKKVYKAPKADALLSETRRQSSRSAAVQNKLSLVERMKGEEKRRSSVIPAVRVEYKEMTQEERLEEALETEKYNVSTLNKYKEQEFDKQKKKRELMQNKRRKLTDVMTVKTFVKYVEIEEERELEKFLLTRDVLKKRDRRGRKSEKQKREEEESREKEKELKQKWELLNNPGKSIIEDPEAEVPKEDQSIKDEANGTVPDLDATPVKDSSEPAYEEKDLTGPTGSTGPVSEEKYLTGPASEEKDPNEPASESKSLAGVDDDGDAKVTGELEPFAGDGTKITVEDDEIKDSIKQSDGEAKVDVEMTDVTAGADVIKTEDITIAEPTPEVEKVSFEEETKIVYEGPKQKVGAACIAFENKYPLNKLRVILFGEPSLLPVNRRSIETVPEVRIKLADDAYDRTNTSFTKQVDLSVLDAFPDFGDFSKKRTQVQQVEEVEATKVVLKTSPPSGITLKNGNRKMCLITGKDAMYFHPGTGMPYASVDSFKVIQDVQNGEFKWVEYGYVGSYHAKGVPEGFDV